MPPDGSWQARQYRCGAGAADGNLDLPAIQTDRIDPIMLSLATALIPAFQRPSELTALFADHVVAAVGLHIANIYGAGTQALLKPQGLALWQQRRVTDMLKDALSADVQLGELAAACGLSPGYFAKAFRRSFGLPPHRWLLRERAERAAALIKDTDQRLGDIAVACGFVDPSHLSRVFRRVIGTTPAAWRRAHKPQ